MKILFKVEKYEAQTIQILSDLMRDADLTVTGNPQVNITYDIEMHHLLVHVHLTITLQYSGSI